MKNPNALNVKKWCIDTIGEAGWLIIVSRSYPELLQCDRKISIINISERTVFDQDHINVLNKYLWEVYGCEIPESISSFSRRMEQYSGFKIEWKDKVTGRMKISYTLKRPISWFSDLLSNR
ncbi:hypothetical protein SAMN04488029_1224 [Reichenbachiella faecimaris]|uniref:Uncharacterized protein n=1 Tax=Reichenbachiella faecimaris TaxID=692418 RepID=A0A1W2G8P0_REIFA|nr:hypothetical protein [Reichenbachiella faecimaris]SMD32864.1 hypothetical protein SAMN04488029_1224 [Reichenbachiella faecimaris]